MSMFSPGEEVICINNSPGFGSGEPCPSVKGSMYIVLIVDDFDGAIVTNGDRNSYWSESRFRRPVIDKDKTGEIIKTRIPNAKWRKLTEEV